MDKQTKILVLLLALTVISCQYSTRALERFMLPYAVICEGNDEVLSPGGA